MTSLTDPSYAAAAGAPRLPISEGAAREAARARAAAARDHTLQHSSVKTVAAAGEALALLAVSLVVSAAIAADLGALRVPVVAATAAFAMLLVKVTGGYRMPIMRRPAVRIARVMAAWTGAVGAMALALFVAGVIDGAARHWLGVLFGSGTVVLCLSTMAIAASVRHLTAAGRLQRRTVLVGGGPNAEALIGALDRTGGNEVSILGIFDDRADDRSPESQAGYPKLGNLDDLVEFARAGAVDMVIVSIPMTAETRLLQMLKKLWVLPVDIRLSAHGTRLRLRPRSYSYIGAVPLLDLFDKPISGWDSVIKRVFDVVIASLAIVLLSPVFLGVAAAVKWDSRGPALFRQKRYGFNNEVISVLKFRSMFTDMADPAAKKVVTRDDPRVTRVGRIIRKTSLDELPQLFNVLRGELSLVGPRPHAVNAHTHEQLWEEVVDGYFARHKVKPGVTGWAQVNGLRGEVDAPEKIRARVDHDLYYIENWSVLFDFYILCLTPIRILNQENAY
ncbi:undecaprenyl-phosphate glucose phosphotransferase [Mongoliimonas terrestris]|uniref:undecaprenyl-phosphate glucose phosphotransferase n=1 Tax=Mongoliimonas terrestris TaxID=1709001 RepID=UPI000949545D|nr:undecaprenyl-phosphate glucose phosphotransferase [Mongoliimonas terrestris]